MMLRSSRPMSRQNPRLPTKPARDNRFRKDGSWKRKYWTRDQHAEWMRSQPQAVRRLGIKKSMIKVWEHRKESAA